MNRMLRSRPWQGAAAALLVLLVLSVAVNVLDTGEQPGVPAARSTDGFVAADLEASATRQPQPSKPASTQPPEHVVVTQGPTDPEQLYALVSWDRSDPAATGYEVVRDGAAVAQLQISGDPWDDLAWTDRSVHGSRTYDYQVRALYADGGRSSLSSAASVAIRTDGDVGSGGLFRVDEYSGTDLQRAQAAVAAAKAARGGIVLFGPRTYVFDGALIISGTNDVVLRGAGTDQTFLQPGFDGTTTDCGGVGELVVFRGRREMVTGVSLAEPIRAGDQTALVTSTGDLTVGQVVVLDEVQSGDPGAVEAAGVVADPGTGKDRRNPWDANEIVGIDSNRLSFRHPFSQAFSTKVPWQRIGQPGRGNGIERLTVQGRSADEQQMYKLIFLDYQVNFTLADVQGRWANRNYLEPKGYQINVVDFRGPYGGPRSYDAGSCKYKFTINRGSNLLIINSTFGEPSHDNNQSYLTLQRAQRILVRHSRFYGSRTYAINEHGSGGRDNVIENNLIAVGPRASYSAIFLGNSSWGFAGSFMIRNNSFSGNRRDLYLQENSYETRFLYNRSDGNTYRVIDGYGWAGPDTDPNRYGSLRLTVAYNTVTNAKGDGVALGGSHSPWYPFPGVRDVIIASNRFQVAGAAVRLRGSSSATNRFQVSGNTGSRVYRRPRLRPGDYWSGNADGLRYGRKKRVPWANPTFEWEQDN